MRIKVLDFQEKTTVSILRNDRGFQCFERQFRASV